MAYGLMKKDQFIFWSNCPGVVLGLFYSVNSLTILASQTAPNEELCDLYKTVEGLLLFAFAFWSLIFLIGVTAFNKFPDPKYQMEELVGQLSMMFAIAYYVAPLYTAYEILRTKDSSSLYGPVLVINLINSSLWFIYGLALLDFNLYFPNLFGVPLTVLQIVLLVVYSRHKDVKHIFFGDDNEAVEGAYGRGDTGDGLPRKASVLSSSEMSATGSAVPPTEKQMVRSDMFDDYMDEEFR
jgi:solute carrier family 50 protein (sugar transporter)